MTTVVLIGTLDTKGEEYGFVRDRLRGEAVEVLLVDAGVLGEPHVEPDVSREEVARAAGADIGSSRAAQTGARRSRPWLAGPARYSGGCTPRAGSTGSSGSAARRRHLAGHLGHAGAARRGAQAAGLDRRLGRHAARTSARADITMMYSVVDIAGHQPHLRPAPDQRRRRRSPAWPRRRGPAAAGDARSPSSAATHVRRHHPAASTAARERLEALGYEVLVFHATGDRRADDGGPDRRRLHRRRPRRHHHRAGRRAGRRRPLAPAPTAWRPPGSGDPPGHLARRPRHGQLRADGHRPGAVRAGAHFYEHNPTVTLMRTTPEENAGSGGASAAKLNAARGPVHALRPAARRLSLIDAEGQLVPIPRPTRPCSTPSRATCDSGCRGARAGHRHQRPGVRPGDGRRVARALRRRWPEPHEMHPMNRAERSDRLRAQVAAGRADHRRRGRHRALGQVRRGRRRRPDHHLQLGALPHGRRGSLGRPAALRRRQRRSSSRWRAEVLPVVKETPVLAGRLRHRPLPPDAGLPEAAQGRLGFAGVQNFPPSACSTALPARTWRRPAWASTWRSR